MAEVSSNGVMKHLLAVLDEAFAHPERPWSYFTDPGPDSGYFGVLSRLDAGQAGRSIAGSSVAAQVNHVTFAMRASSAFIQGDREPPGLERWRQSWQVPHLDEQSWKRMQAELREAYEDLRRAIERHGMAQELSLGGAIGAIAHVAYHLGAVKQKIALDCGRWSPNSSSTS